MKLKDMCQLGGPLTLFRSMYDCNIVVTEWFENRPFARDQQLQVIGWGALFAKFANIVSKWSVARPVWSGRTQVMHETAYESQISGLLGHEAYEDPLSFHSRSIGIDQKSLCHISTTVDHSGRSRNYANSFGWVFLRQSGLKFMCQVWTI